MIKHIISAALLMACALPLSAQDLQDEQTPKPKGTNYLTFDLGGGLHSVAFKADNADKKPGFGFGAQVGYRHFFNQNWGIGIGAGFNTFAAKATMNYNQDEHSGTDASILSEHKERNYHTAFTDVEEKITASALDIPIGVYYQRPINDKWSFGAGLNVIVSTIASKKFKNNSGNIGVVAEYPYYQQTVSDVPAHGLTNFSGFSGTPDFKSVSIGFGGEAKAYYAINDKLDLAIGISGAFRFSDLQNQKVEKLFDEDTRSYVGVTQSALCDGVKLANISATVGIRYRLVPKIKPVAAPDFVDVFIEPLYIADAIDIIELPVEEEKVDRSADDFGINIMPEDYAYANNALDMSKQLRRKKVGDPIGAPILFETNSDRLKSDVNTIMDTVVVFMIENPDVTKLEVSAHTDNVGSDAYNLQLSKRRANTVVNYLVSHGVERKRIVPVGYGESRPLNKNATPQQREINRRVEFMILELAE
ncbi:MAG: OmpA family protein [Bacteroidales bacterium]|nr:OmpA family protein [Bacteroidales bacterium]